MFILSLISLLAPGAPALAQPSGTSPFNHASTGFLLDGAHARAPCEDCHKPGVPARGTPRTCNACHLAGSARASTFKPTNHIPTTPTQSCGDCHNQFTWAPATMRHTADMAGQCARCHNGAQAGGKPATHIPTTSSCDACHRVGAWMPPKVMVHDASSVGRCSTCHDGRTALGKPSFHVPTTAQCDTCHTSTVTFKNALYTHDPSTWGRCSQCHNGVTAIGQSVGHVPTGTRQCDTCHTSQVSFHVVAMNHTGMAGQCSTCHGGAYLSQNAQSKPATHVVTTAQCDSCHTSTTTWATATMNHAALVPAATGRCTDCHLGGPGLTKPLNHIPTSAQCDSCHTNYVAFKPATMNHAGTAGQCATCHVSTYAYANAQYKSAIHIPDARSCDACHLNFVTFSPANMNHTGLNGKCSTCHSGAYLSANAQMKPATHVPTTAQCDTCHSSTTSWATAGHVHTAADTGMCSNCHYPGGPGLSKPANHIPTALQCDTCHTNYVAFKPAAMNHAGTTGQCSNCHNGSFTFARALAQDASHIPDKRQCDTCHKIFTAFKPAVMDHTGTAGACTGCHSGAYVSKNALAKGATHVPTSQQCDFCHQGGFLAWTTPPRMNHTGLTGQCTTCHNGSYLAANAQAKSGAHVPTTAQCDACHLSTTVWTGTKHLATGIAGQCQTCHNGAYLAYNALTTPGNHIPYASQLLAGASMSCDKCHTSTVSWASQTMNHNNSMGNGSGWCKGCHLTGTSYLGAMKKMTLTHRSSTVGGVPVTDCSQSGCHRPLGNTGSTYRNWN